MEDQSAVASTESSSSQPLESERRRHPRYFCEGHAEVFVPHGALLFRGRILNLSVSGCFIETLTLSLERGTHVEVYFVAHRLQFRVSGYIAVLHPKHGAGISFQEMGARRARMIAELVQELQEEAKAGTKPTEVSAEA